MVAPSAYLLIAAVAAVGVLHTAVPDHWAPIALLARQRGWTTGETVRAAALAGTGHTLSTLLIAAAVWLGGVALASRSGELLSRVSSIALVGFGAWIALTSLREILTHRREHGQPDFAHSHAHRHGDGAGHQHWHEHNAADWHRVEGKLAFPPTHAHSHTTSSRTALLLILGSSPMIEGIPAFFAASRYGLGQLAVMAAVFAVCTIGTYVTLSVGSARGLQHVNLGPLERYGEVLSGAFIAVLGVVFLVFPNL